MTPQEIIEGNKLIALFDGWRLETKFDSVVYNTPKWFHEERNWSIVLIEGMEYHSSWDWLMPVVEKIESFDYDTRICRLTFSCNSIIKAEFIAQIETRMGTEIIYKIGATSKIEAVWLAVVEFITWYNRQK